MTKHFKAGQWWKI